MSDMISAIERTRETAASIVSSTLTNYQRKTEQEIRDCVLEEMARHGELFPRGWYDPPPGGVSILIGKERMAFDSLRKPKYWPRSDIRYSADTPTMIYVSPVDRATQMLGDFGLTIYQGSDTAIQNHIKQGLSAVLDIAECARIGMSFADLYAAGREALAQRGFEHARISTITSNAGDSNFGHTVPWSDGEAPPGELLIDQLREKIRVARRFINLDEHYVISPTCAFMVESRLFDREKPTLPNILFHVIVTFSEGRKRVLTNFEEIFKQVGMEYML
ncbi:hypothetical protein A3A38_01530 [Candidatus Kaiserbacteria bacterium RIFCSPLOWO2_01_FULL_53_17]|uniref:Peptidase M24 domain-containing protein n=1 Tax=Candidatus Kaiserbacteria bacterium RIFCSPLOWO2_01_FULL_53_17 TaxID=1798511 RepID=A0A1F6EI93_9BACT|nr:MAG: hypothetical protein A3A38_01530 [Candidatus Kaiserbacteria bacterium RIFCSPLOWO2_01_FULL_53_17]